MRSILTMLRRRWRYLCGAVVVAVCVAMATSWTTEPRYRATIDLIYVKQPDIASALAGAVPVTSTIEVTQQVVTYAKLMTTNDMQVRAEEWLGLHRLDRLDVEVSAEGVPDTSLLRITVTAPEPALAQRVAQGYADAFTAWRKQVVVDQYRAAERIVLDKMRRYTPEQVAARDPGYVQLAGRLQDLRVLRASATGNFAVAARAALPTEPYIPNHVRDLILGLAVGLLAGIGLVVLAEQLDVRIHDADELADAVALPVLGRVPRVASSEAEASAVRGDLSGPLAEAFRILRGNLEFADIDGHARSVMVTSAVQGEGKSTTVANLALAVAMAGRRVIAVDCDLRRARLHRAFGLRNPVGLSSVLTGKATLDEALQTLDLPSPADGGDVQPGSLRVLTSGPLPPNPGEIAGSQRLGELIAQLAEQADLVLIDAAPLLVVGDAAALARHVDAMVLVARLNVFSRTMVREVREAVTALPCRVLGLVITGIPTEAAAYRYRYYKKSEESEDPREPKAMGEPSPDAMVPVEAAPVGGASAGVAPPTSPQDS